MPLCVSVLSSTLAFIDTPPVSHHEADPTVVSPPRSASSRWVREQRSTGAWHLNLEAVTDVPIDVGARLTLEMPYRLRISTSLGVMPGPYVDVINAIATSAGAYDESTATVIRGALERSLVSRTHLGWRPLRRYGWYFEAGYGLVTLGGTVTGRDVLIVTTGLSLPEGGRGDALEYDVTSTLHMIDIETGWRFLVWDDRIVLRLALGFAGTVSARTRATPLETLPSRASAGAEVLAREAEAYLDDIYTSYVFTPVVTAGVGYRFF